MECAAPQEGWLEVNVDGALDDSSGEGRIGVVITDGLKGEKCSSLHVSFCLVDAEEVEALACKEGLALAAEWCQ